MEQSINNLNLLELRLHNFKKHRDLTIAPDGGSLTILGDNRVGKSSIFDALQWLLVDKDSKGNATGNFGLKTRDGNDNPIHNLEHSVEGVFEGITLRKIYEENWVKHRGDSEATLEGHTCSYYVDDVPVKKTDFDQSIAASLRS